MARRLSPNSARRHPTSTFGLAGGAFALPLVAATSARQLAAGRGVSAPSGLEATLVVGGFVGAALVAQLLWARLGAAESPLRGTAVGGLIGLLALPGPMYLLEFTTLALDGIPFDPRPGATPWMQAGSYLFLLVAAPLVLGAIGITPTRGGTILVGAATGYVLARR